MPKIAFGLVPSHIEKIGDCLAWPIEKVCKSCVLRADETPNYAHGHIASHNITSPFVDFEKIALDNVSSSKGDNQNPMANTDKRIPYTHGVWRIGHTKN